MEGAVAPGVRAFQEKPEGDGAWVNGGFFVLERAVLDRSEGTRSCSSRGRWKAWPRTTNWCLPTLRVLAAHGCLRDLRALQLLGVRGGPVGGLGEQVISHCLRSHSLAPPTFPIRPCPVCGSVVHDLCCMLQRFDKFTAGSITDAYDVVACRTCWMCFASGLPDPDTIFRVLR